MQNDTVVRLAQVPNIVGIKDATANLERGADLIRRAPKGFTIYSGDDGTALPLMLMGGDGVISVTANVAPRLMHDLCAAAFAADLAKAQGLNNKLLGLHRHLFVEANPIPVKWVLQEMGMVQSGIRLPLTPLSSSFHDLLRGAMEQAGIAARMPVT
jgi:4-hydroxy-tetrahydrodipicolinate synthase